MAILPDDEPPMLKRDGSRASDVSVEKVDEKVDVRDVENKSVDGTETESLDEVIVRAEDVAVKVCSAHELKFLKTTPIHFVDRLSRRRTTRCPRCSRSAL